MSLRYAHLAPDQRREAVVKLNDKPLLALSLRLQWNSIQTMDLYFIDELTSDWDRKRCGAATVTAVAICRSHGEQSAATSRIPVTRRSRRY
jgi:hypothetical protein